jgi:hypothetical protein
MVIVSSLDEQFARLHERSSTLVLALPPEKLYSKPGDTVAAFPTCSCGESILRSAAVVEQTFGGITVNLWDDPFEWTLPESLPTTGHVINYLNEVESTIILALGSFRSDEDLIKEIAAPPGGLRTLFSLVIESLGRAAHHQGRAFATFSLLSPKSLPRGGEL